MKVTALGVNSAFATGDFEDAVTLTDVDKTLASLKGKISLKALRTELARHRQRVYKPRWQSNFILEFAKPGGGEYRLALDFGTDFRHSLKAAGMDFGDIDGYYCSHPHADHIGGVEGIALSTIFNPLFRPGKAAWLKNPQTGQLDLVARRLAMSEPIPAEFKPDIFGHKSVLNELWSAARPGLETIQGVPDVNLQTYFNVHYFEDNKPRRMEDGDRYWDIYTVVSVHVQAGYRQMPSYGLMLNCSDGKIIFMPTDTQFMTPRQVSLYYDKADIIYQDCETGPRSDVHPHIDDLRTLPESIRKKCILYHYSDDPDIQPGEFHSILRTGETHVY